MTKASTSCCKKPESELLMVQVSVPANAAEPLSRGIVETRLAACVQQFGIRSTYVWNASIEHADETLLLIKTTTARYADLENWIVAHHPYAVPEIIASPMTHVLPAYAQWVGNATASATDTCK